MRRYRKSIRHPESIGVKNKSDKNTLFYDHYLDLHGLTGDEAVFSLKNFISTHRNAVVLVSHGKGSGTLRSRIRLFLRDNPSVTNVLYGENVPVPEGDGVTIINI